ncbi:MAG: endonuclease III [Pseudomonadota bacterium]
MKSHLKLKKVVDTLIKEYGKPKTALEYKHVHELVIAVILSAQCTDKRVNEITKDLFKKFIKIEDFATCEIKALEGYIKSGGLYKNKAKNIKKMAQIVVKKYESRIPNNREYLESLPGIGRKTASVILSTAFGLPAMAVDTHVIRLSNRIGLTKSKDPLVIEKDLTRQISEKFWSLTSLLLINHGRAICKARKPNCEECKLNKICEKNFKT